MLTVDCDKMGFIFRIVVKLLFYVRILVPILLIVLIIFDLVKVVTGNADDKAKSEAVGKASKRLIYAVLVFLVPTVLNFVFKAIEKYGPKDNYGTSTSWVSCWNYYNK